VFAAYSRTKRALVCKVKGRKFLFSQRVSQRFRSHTLRPAFTRSRPASEATADPDTADKR